MSVATLNPVSGEFETFDRVPVVSDSPEWEAARLQSLGASEVSAVLGISPYATALDVYRGKFGVGRDIDPELAFIGHAEEVVIGKWMRAFRPELGVVRRGFMARSIESPWLHASFDRFLVKRGQWRPVQMKTAHQYAGKEWEDGAVPLAVQAQIQTELYVFGAPVGYAVAFVGGRRFHLQPIERDEEFIRDLLIPQTKRFWEQHVLAQVPPDPTTSAEAVSLWAGGGEPVIAGDEILGLVQLLRRYQEDEVRAKADVERIKLAIQVYMRDAQTLLAPDGKTILATWNPTKESTYTATRKAGRRFTLKKETP